MSLCRRERLPERTQSIQQSLLALPVSVTLALYNKRKPESLFTSWKDLYPESRNRLFSVAGQSRMLSQPASVIL